MVTAAMEMFFCWLDLNNIWLLGCRTLPARLGPILRPAPCCRGATASSAGHEHLEPKLLRAFLPAPLGPWLGFKEQSRRKESGGGRGKKTSFH